MNKALTAAIGLMLLPLPALSQDVSRSDDNGSYDRRDRDDAALRDLLRDMSGDGPSRGAFFRLRSGDSSVTVRCDTRDSMRACVDATLTLLERASRSLPSGGGASGPGQTTPPR